MKYEKEFKDVVNARNKLKEQQSGDSMSVVDLEAQYHALMETKAILQEKAQEMKERLEDEEEINVDYRNKKDKLINFTKEQHCLRDALKNKLIKVQEEKDGVFLNARDLEEHLRNLKDNMDTLQYDCVQLEEQRFNRVRELQEQEAKISSIFAQNSRLQEQVDAAELDYELEKKSKDDIEKQFKKLEAEVRMNQQTIMDINSDKDRLREILRKADNEYEALNNKYEDELSAVVQFQGKIKNIIALIDKIEEDLDLARSDRGRADRTKNELEAEYKSQRELCNEQETMCQKQNEHNKKLSIDIQKYERDLEEKRIGLQSALDTLRKKFADQHADTIHEVSELEKHNQKLERESDILIEKRQTLTDKIKELNNLRTVQEREINHLEDAEKAIKQKCIDDDHKLTEQLSNKARMITEIAELKRTLNEKDSVQQILFRFVRCST